MTRRHIVIAGSLLSLVAASALMAQPARDRRLQPGDRAPAGRPIAPTGEDLNFEAGMKIAGRASRGLRRTAFDASSRENDLAAIGQIQHGLVIAKNHLETVDMAPQAEQAFGTDNARYQSAFREQLIAALRAALDLEEAVIKGQSDDARAALNELLTAQRDGHDQFKHDDEDE